MGVISVKQTDRLYWLGRYMERVYTTMRLYFVTYDTMLDKMAKEYKAFCESLEIPDIYSSPEHFCQSYAFDRDNENSMMSNLVRAYDNAIVLRDEIGSETLSYVQLAIYEMQKAEQSETPIIEFQKVLDNIMAFWGICDDIISDENVRNIIKIGKRVERIDLFGRLKSSREDLLREYHRLAGRINRCNLKYRQDVLDNIGEILEGDTEKELDYGRIVKEIESILDC